MGGSHDRQLKMMMNWNIDGGTVARFMQVSGQLPAPEVPVLVARESTDPTP